MSNMQGNTVLESLEGFFRRNPQLPTLFAGAGISCRVGLPDWHHYIESLAQTCEEHGDRLAAGLMRQRADDNDYLGAASVYKTSKRIPRGELLKGLARPLRVDPSSTKLRMLYPLIELPWSAIVTTNFDSAISQALTSKKKWHSPVERGDGSLRNASTRTDFYVARIHGREDLPKTMILDNNDYESLRRDEIYNDFLLSLLRSRSCLFAGFSFADPAIDFVLDRYDELCGPSFPTLHLALIPDNAPSLEARLGAVNIEVAKYSPRKNHAEMWRVIRAVQKSTAKEVDVEATTLPQAGEGSFKRLLAFAYAQMQIESRRQPIMETVAESLLLSLVEERAETGVKRPALVEGLRETLAVDRDEAQYIVESALGRLVATSRLNMSGDYIVAGDERSRPALAETLSALATSVEDRVVVREEHRFTKDDLDKVAAVLEQLFMIRAWDLAAHYAGVAAGWGKDLPKVVDRVAQAIFEADLQAARVAKEGVLDLLTAPEGREADMLATVGRAAFGIQLALSSPRQAMLQKHSLPDRVYLDANILLPAITPGHPLKPAYQDLLTRLAEANQAVGSELEVIASSCPARSNFQRPQSPDGAVSRVH